jgi:hypothetical protein
MADALAVPLLLISRGSFSGGQIISQCLSKMAGIKCLTREDLIAAVNLHGELATRVTASIGGAARNYAEFSALRRPYKILMRLAMLEQVRQGDVAYFGYSGHLLLQGIAHAVRVRLVAPVELRVKLLVSREKCGEEQARERIHQEDEERSRWALFMYGKNLHDPESFDLCINLERLSFPAACDLLLNVARQPEFQPTPESVAAVENQHLNARVLAALVNDCRTFELELQATAQDGKVLLEGPYLEDEMRRHVLDVARQVPGVQEVNYTEGCALAFDMSF